MLKIGMAQKDITPPLGSPIAGNFREDYGCRGVYHRLYARAMVFDNGRQRIGIAVADLAGVSAEMVRVCRQKIKETCSMEPSNIMIAATHTHSGPDVMGLIPDQRVDVQTVEMVQSGIAEAVIEADRNKVLARVGFGSGKEGTIAHNRRLRLMDGKTHMNWEKIEPGEIKEILGPIDPEVGVIKIEDIHGKPLGVFINYTCHPAILAGDNYLISADYPGFTYQRLKDIFGQAVLVIFSNGAEGNINQIDPYNPAQKRGFEEAERLGNKLADEVANVYRQIKTFDSALIKTSTEELLVPRRKISDERLNWAKKVLAEWDGKTLGLVDGLPDIFYAREAMMLKEKENEPVSSEIQVMRVGDMALVGLPGEVFVEYGLEIKDMSHFKKTFIIGLANDYIGYVPTLKAFQEGGYEPTPCRGSQLTETAGEMLVESALRQLKCI